MAKGVFKSIETVCKRIKKDLDTQNPKKPDATKVSVLYACNASGKTRLSKFFYDKYKGKVLYYNAFTEDLFSWDNENYALKFNKNAWIFQVIKDEGLEQQIVDNYQKFTGSKLEPTIDMSEDKSKDKNKPKDKNEHEGRVTFALRRGDNKGSENIKISRGEESVFIWSIYYTILENAINVLNDSPEDRSTKVFDKIKYIVIDDPVSSMDDTRIITIALELIELIKKSNNDLSFLITTHHALFFNVLFNVHEKNWDRKNYILSKLDEGLQLKGQGNDSPFAYHHVIISEIKDAIKQKDIKRYHFNLFRSLLEKTANFLGYQSKNKCFEAIEDEKLKDGLDVFKKTLEHYSHNRLWDLEPNNVSELEQVAFEQTFNAFIEKFNWGIEKNGK